MIDLQRISLLHRDPSGIWVSEINEPVSFPTDGNASRVGKEENSFWYLHRNRTISAAVSNFPPAGTILDVGGGNGTVSLHLQQQGFDVLLLEPEWEAAKEARSKGVIDVICSTFDAAQLTGNSIPAMGLFDVLEHIPDDVAFLERIRDSLCTNGMLYLTVPAFEFLWSEADLQAGHYRRYTVESVSTALCRAGFSIKYVSYFFSILMLPVFIARSLPYRLRIGHADSNWRHGHHQSRKKMSGRLAYRALSLEAGLIGRGSKIPFGSSCIVVAQKIER